MYDKIHYKKKKMLFPNGSEVKASASNAGDLGSIPGSGRSPGEGNGNPLQYSCLENPMDGGAWWATVHGVTKSWTWLSDFTSLHLPQNMREGISATKRALRKLQLNAEISLSSLRSPGPSPSLIHWSNMIYPFFPLKQSLDFKLILSLSLFY